MCVQICMFEVHVHVHVIQIPAQKYHQTLAIISYIHVHYISFKCLHACIVKHKHKKITFYVWLQDRYTRPDYTFKVVARGFSKKCTISEQLFEVHVHVHVYCSFKKILHVYMYV